MKRRICILTQPLSNGYGCLLQAYALQTVLKREDHFVVTEDRKQNTTRKELIKKWIKNSLIPFLGPLLTPLTHVHYSTFKTDKIINGAPIYFKKNYLSITPKIYSNDKKIFRKFNFDTFIVGSDQVWRPRYTPGKGSIYNYFLDFAENQDVKRIAYAASFGIPNWEFSDMETKECARLIKKFDAVSVREDSGVRQCENYFGVNATHVLDPTLLLDKKDYIALIEAEKEPHYKDRVFCYCLDPSEEKEKITDTISSWLNLSKFSIMPTEHFYNVGKKQIDKCKYKSVTAWLQAFNDADFIITDSFHGTVFSIIFNKPFVTIANKGRGISRFTSLLKIFGLENRLIFSIDDLDKTLVNRSINFDEVNLIKEDWKNKSLNFLLSALNSSDSISKNE